MMRLTNGDVLTVINRGEQTCIKCQKVTKYIFAKNFCHKCYIEFVAAVT
jgi:hypothetical protein